MRAIWVQVGISVCAPAHPIMQQVFFGAALSSYARMVDFDDLSFPNDYPRRLICAIESLDPRHRAIDHADQILSILRGTLLAKLFLRFLGAKPRGMSLRFLR